MHGRGLSIKNNFSTNCIVATDDTAVWSHMVGNTDKNSTDYKDSVQVSRWLAAKADGTKMKTCVVFKAAKRKAATSSERFEM